jgi:hypothetical protein
MANGITGDSFYLKGETYNITSNYLLLPTRGRIYGAGKYATIITSNQVVSQTHGILTLPPSNEIISDLSLIQFATASNALSKEGIPISSSGSSLGYNTIIRNVYLQTHSFGIGYGTIPSLHNNLSIYNTTINSTNGVPFSTNYGISLGDGPGGSLKIFDSNIVVNTITPAAIGISFVSTSSFITANIVNTTISVSGATSINSGISFSTSFGTASMSIFGGSISTSGAAAIDLFHSGGTGYLGINATTVYTTNSGTVNQIGTAPYGQYSYDRSPIPAPGSWLAPLYSVTFNQISPSGNWIANIIVTDGTGLSSESSTTYFVNLSNVILGFYNFPADGPNSQTYVISPTIQPSTLTAELFINGAATGPFTGTKAIPYTTAGVYNFTIVFLGDSQYLPQNYTRWLTISNSGGCPGCGGSGGSTKYTTIPTTITTSVPVVATIATTSTIKSSTTILTIASVANEIPNETSAARTLNTSPATIAGFKFATWLILVIILVLLIIFVAIQKKIKKGTKEILTLAIILAIIAILLIMATG